jgi:predicted regulator of Ras-like GTPase activity (Roadblock/LC7/MglB family)
VSLQDALGGLLRRVQEGEGVLVMDRDGLPVEVVPGANEPSPEAISVECVPLLRGAEALVQGLNLGAWVHLGLLTARRNIHFVPLGEGCTLALLTRASGNAATGRRLVREEAPALRALL